MNALFECQASIFPALGSTFQGRTDQRSSTEFSVETHPRQHEFLSSA